MVAQVVSFQCTLKNSLGHVLSYTVNRDVLTGVESGNQGLRALTLALTNLQEGERRTVCIPAKEAYGFYDPTLVVTRSREELSSGQSLKLGELVKYRIDGQERLCRVAEADSLNVTLDANHPFAGQDLIFEIEATAVRAADPEEFTDSAEETLQLVH